MFRCSFQPGTRISQPVTFSELRTFFKNFVTAGKYLRHTGEFENN